MTVLAQEIEAVCREHRFTKFPYSDCRKLQKLKPRITLDLGPDLNAYSMFITGYSSRATILADIPQGDLRAAIPKLKKSFLDWHPRYEPVLRHVSPNETPALFLYLQIAERLRNSLAALIEAIFLSH
jgi:hypothetical protein